MAPDWEYYGRGTDTLVFYMAVAELAATAAQLIAHGRGRAVPAALIERGSTPQQRVLLATLSTIAAAARAHAIVAPAVLIVGEQAARARDFSWYGSSPIDVTALARAA